MRVSVSAHFEPVPAGTLCSSCATPTSAGVIFRMRTGSSEDQEGPFCLICLLNSTHTLVLEPPEERARTPVGGVKKRSQAQEQKIAADLGGRAQPNSGALAHAKGDVRKKGHFRVEAKYTSAKSYAVHREDLDKIRSEALYPEKPAFVVDFLNKTGSSEDSWVLIPYDDWLEYTNAATDNKRSPKR